MSVCLSVCVLLLILMGSGFTITRGKLKSLETVIFTVFTCIYTIIYLVLLIWEAVVSVCLSVCVCLVTHPDGQWVHHNSGQAQVTGDGHLHSVHLHLHHRLLSAAHLGGRGQCLSVCLCVCVSCYSSGRP